MIEADSVPMPREVPHDHPDGMPVLRALDTNDGVPVMSKTWRSNQGELISLPYDSASRFQVRTLAVDSIQMLVFVLAFMKAAPHACVIRGALLPGADWTNTKRRSNPQEDSPATFGNCPRGWVLLDYDGFSTSDFPDPAVDPIGCIEAVRQRLPEGLRSVACFWSFSSSTGMKPEKLGVHFWFLLETALDWRSAEAFIRACGADTAMSRTVQVHYTASPVFMAPLKDPLPQRFGVLDGVERVDAATVSALVTQGMLMVAKANKPTRNREAKIGRSRVARNSAEALEICPHDMIGDGHRHEHLTSLAGFGRKCGLERYELAMLLEAENQNHCSPPLDDDEVGKMAGSFVRYPPGPEKFNDPDCRALSIMSGLLRHGACDQAIIHGLSGVTGSTDRAEQILTRLTLLPRCLIEAAETHPHLILKETLP